MTRFETLDVAKAYRNVRDQLKDSDNMSSIFSPLARAVLDSFNEGVVVFDPHGRVVYASAGSRILPHGRQQLVVALNRDPVEVTRTEWDVRLLWNTFCNYADVLYLPDDKSLLVSVETLRPGRTTHSCAAIRYFKMSLRYWHALPPFVDRGASQGGAAKKECSPEFVGRR